MKRSDGVVKVAQDPALGAYPYGRPTTGKKQGKRPASTVSHYKKSTSIVNGKVGAKSKKFRQPNNGHHLDSKKSPRYWEQNGKRVGTPAGKRERRGEMEKR